ncbi:hypothetical protein K493DRAFT_307612 [Basidiobolus meristosporus CBS 931.73]|uniref:SNF2 N-terminal domain-containing protein n=1 Tax=Basidiobolus meristosporus CBS 931.73 TaxID=1314790 RepID=A0A1Y1XCL9_9FUNG|nr:hypothetical protein K493DRAFT_307612 [Basidiobolus meristosporus CBS 931.73]|eukprot:ORX83462.1 hypothetical protein K493DRAFT_307612 [Basidiobolus meristosporus CBS 931.73]
MVDIKAKWIVLTTYHMLCVEAKNSGSPIWKVEFGQVVADEAVILKNYSGGSINAIAKVNGKSLILITMTPFQNDLIDLYLYFILFGQWEGTPKDLQQLLNEENNANWLVNWLVKRLGHIVLRQVPESQLLEREQYK